MNQPDDELVRQAQRGDREAFALLIRRFERRVLAVAFAVLADGDAAGDVAQDAFVRAWQRMAELREPGRFGAWLCEITRNLARDTARNRVREARAHAAMVTAGGPSGNGHAVSGDALDPALQLARQERDRRIEAALAVLDETSRAAVVLRYYENLGSREIGELLDLSASAVDMRLSRARGELRKLLGE